MIKIDLAINWRLYGLKFCIDNFEEVPGSLDREVGWPVGEPNWARTYPWPQTLAADFAGHIGLL
jgi:hypothetical protein